MAFASTPTPQPNSGDVLKTPATSPLAVAKTPAQSAPVNSGYAVASRPATPRPRANASALRAQRQYQQAQIETASPTRLVVLLYEGAIRFCSLALEAMQEKNLQEQNQNLLKAQRILGELMSSLDKEAGGEVAANLFRLYVHMLEQLVHANLHDDAAAIENVVKNLSELRDTWAEIDLMTTQAQAVSGTMAVTENV